MNKELIKEAETCNNCKCWLKHCNAECCRMFTIKDAKGNGLRPIVGCKIRLRCNLSQNMVKYYELHGCKYVHGILIIPIINFEWRGMDLIVYNKCEWLGDNNLCIEYEDRPAVCRNFSLETKNDSKFMITDNCLFRYKNE